MCFQCDYPFISTKALNSHIQHRQAKGMQLTKFTNRKDLYTHCMSQHGGNDVYEIPPYVEDLNNPELQAEYAINRRHILAGDEDSDLKKVYNFPSNNLHRGFNEIRGHLTQYITTKKMLLE